MELIHNATFRLLLELNSPSHCLPGIYRVILDEPKLNEVIAVLIEPDGEPKISNRGRRKSSTTKKRKKAPPKLIGELVWMDRDILLQLKRDGQPTRHEH